MKYIFKFKFLVLSISMLSITFTSCNEDDSIVASQEPEKITLATFLERAPKSSFNSIAEETSKAFLTKELTSEFQLGSVITTDQIESVLLSFPKEISDELANLEVETLNDFTNFDSVNNLSDNGLISVNLTNVADLFPIKANALETFKTFLQGFEESLKNQRQVLIDEGQDPAAIQPSDIVVSPLRFTVDDVYTVFDILGSNNKFTLFLTRGDVVFPEIEISPTEKVKIENGPRFTNLFLNNIIVGQELNYDDLTNGEIYKTAGGNDVTLEELVEEEEVKGELVEVKMKKLLNATIDPIFKNISGATNGIIHEVDELINIVP